MRRILIGLVILALAAGGCSEAPAAKHTAGDIAFVQALVPHHREGIELARAAARDPRVRVLAEAIIVTQQDEIVRMSGWLEKWGAAEPAPAGTPPAVPGDPIGALAAHQEEAIGIAQREQSDGVNEEALAFARQVVESRSEQIVRLRAVRPSAPPG